MYYDDNFVKSLPKNFDESVLTILKIYREKQIHNDSNGMMETRYLLEALAVAHNASIRSLSYKTPNALNNAFTSVEQDARKRLRKQMERALQDEVENSKVRFSLLLDIGFAYEFSEADINRIQNLINELRDILNLTEQLSKNHKERMLYRLEKLQQELHHRMSNLDKFYGLIGDSGIALGKFGHDAKPFVDRVREILEIVWRSQATAEQLPSSARPALLGTPDSKED